MPIWRTAALFLLACLLLVSIQSAPAETCESLRCCDGGSTSSLADVQKERPSSRPIQSTPVPPPIPDGGPYPIRQKAVLPGLDDPPVDGGATPPLHEYYSGFLDAGIPPSGRGKLYLHYICAMAPGDWTTMPLTLWYNGGPGAPSTYGLFQEFGPFLLTSESMLTEKYRETGVPTPIYNPWTWANVTSICEIDSPGPMGASFCTEGNGTHGSTGGPGGDPYSCGPWTDHGVAAANHRAHATFFRDAFPEFEKSQSSVSIVGESYAGVYVPLFVDEWLNDPLVGPNGKLINFAGFAVGDGFPACISSVGRAVDWCVNLNNVGSFKYPNALPGPYWDVEFFHGHSQMSESLYGDIVSDCTEEELKGITIPLSESCSKLMVQMADEVGLFHVYNLLEACPKFDDVDDDEEGSEGKRQSEVAFPKAQPVARPHRMLSGNAHRNMPSFRRRNNLYPPSPGDGDTGLGAPCLGNAMDAYFDLDEVKRGLGIPLNNKFVVLDNGKGFNYTTTASFVGHIYAKAIDAGLRVLVYEGDTDACGLQTAPIEDVWVPYFGNGFGEWTPVGRLGLEGGVDAAGKTAPVPLGLNMTTRWRPFAVIPGPESRVQGGYVVEWNNGQVSFVSIRGAGHLAPLYRPAASFTMMDAFQRGKSLPHRPWHI